MIYLIKITFAVLVLLPLASMADLLHIELGAANYDSYSSHKEDSPKRFEVLKKTLEDLVTQYGKKGTIYLNDIIPEGLELAMNFAKSWAQAQGYAEIKFIPLLGDYMQMELPKVKSLHLTNPTWLQLPNQTYPQDRKKLTRVLEKVASSSESGLVITTYFLNEMRYLNQNLSSSYQFIQTQKKGYQYFYSSGEDPGYGKPDVFIIKPKATSCPSFFIAK